MEFEWVYTQEQERFRKEVRTWLDKNVPEDMKAPIDPDDRTKEYARFWREKRKELGAKGWLSPTLPKEYGGGGLTGAHATVLGEEFERARVSAGGGGGLVAACLLVWATEEQKQRFLTPLVKGEKTAWQKYTEPKSGADLASYESRAIPDGDDWILTGTAAFVTGRDDPDWLYGPMLTDPDAPRHRNLGFFMIPVPSDGLTIQGQRLVNGDEQHFIFMDNVRVPGDHLIGGDHQGWQVANTVLEQEHGGTGSRYSRAAAGVDEQAENLVSYMRERRQKGESAEPEREPVIQQTTVNAHIEDHVSRNIFAKHIAWLYQSRVEMSWEGPMGHFYERSYGLRNAERIRDVYGMYALLGTKEPRAPQGGAQEVAQRHAFTIQHAGGSINITKVIVARRIGISRTRERAAPTPATAGTTPTSG